MTNFNSDEFLDELNEKLIYLFDASHKSVNELYDSFVASASEVVNKFAPLRKQLGKKKIETYKPWITRGLLKSTKTRNKIFKTFRKNRNDFALKERCKTYCNVLNRLLRQFKQNYYHQILNENKGNSKITWDVVNESVNHKNRNSSFPLKLKISAGYTIAEDSKIIAEEFNNFFVNIGKEMASLIQTCESDVFSKITFEEPLSTSNSIFFVPSTETEVFGLINQLRSHKARKAKTIKSKFIKLANPVVAHFL